jgi:hypothetical protein
MGVSISAHRETTEAAWKALHVPQAQPSPHKSLPPQQAIPDQLRKNKTSCFIHLRPTVPTDCSILKQLTNPHHLQSAHTGMTPTRRIWPNPHQATL